MSSVSEWAGKLPQHSIFLKLSPPGILPPGDPGGAKRYEWHFFVTWDSKLTFTQRLFWSHRGAEHLKIMTAFWNLSHPHRFVPYNFFAHTFANQMGLLEILLPHWPLIYVKKTLCFSLPSLSNLPNPTECFPTKKGFLSRSLVNLINIYFVLILTGCFPCLAIVLENNGSFAFHLPEGKRTTSRGQANYQRGGNIPEGRKTTREQENYQRGGNIPEDRKTTRGQENCQMVGKLSKGGKVPEGRQTFRRQVN